MKIQILSRLRLLWQYYPAFWVFRNEDPSANQKKKKTKEISPCAPARAHGEQCQVKPRSRTQYSEHRLSLLFPKLRLSNFMISSLVTSAVFVQCPNVCTNWAASTQPPLCRCSAPPNPFWRPAGQWPTRLKKRSAEAKVYDLQSSIRPRIEPYRPPAMSSLKQINYYS